MEKKLKVCVYAICKNEEKYVDRWVNSLIDEADYVVVLDTGSTDTTVEKFKNYEPFVTVKQYDYFAETGHFRFDKARNDSLKMVPIDTDICVVLDLDQVPNTGWSDIVRENFAKGYNEVRGYIVDHDQEGNELNRWESRNVHPNSPFFIWTRIIHEGIEYYGNEENKTIFVPEFIINHYPDESKDRSLYRKLLEDAVELYPKDPYYGIYLGIELARRYSKEDSTEAFRRALNECDFTNSKDLEYQMCINLASMTTFDEAITVLNRASKIGYKTRRLYKVYADAYESIGDSDNAIAYLEAALTEVRSYSNDWTDDYYLFTGYIEDKLSLFYYYQKNDPLKSFEYCVKALEKDKDNERLRKNLKFYYESFLEKSGN